MAFERSIVNAIREAILREASRRGTPVKIEKRHGSEFSVAGEPDLFGSIGGRHIEIEVKRPGEKPEPLQFQRLKEWARTGAIVGWATSPGEAVAIIWPELRNETETVPACTREKTFSKSKSKERRESARRPADRG